MAGCRSQRAFRCDCWVSCRRCICCPLDGVIALACLACSPLEIPDGQYVFELYIYQANTIKSSVYGILGRKPLVGGSWSLVWYLRTLLRPRSSRFSSKTLQLLQSFSTFALPAVPASITQLLESGVRASADCRHRRGLRLGWGARDLDLDFRHLFNRICGSLVLRCLGNWSMVEERNCQQVKGYKTSSARLGVSRDGGAQAPRRRPRGRGETVQG